MRPVLILAVILSCLVLSECTSLDKLHSKRAHSLSTASARANPWAGACPFELPPLTIRNNNNVNPPALPWDVNGRGQPSEERSDARARGFRDAIRAHAGEYIVANDIGESIKRVAVAAMNCGLHLGSCGNSAGSVWAYAGGWPAHNPFESSDIVRYPMNNLHICRSNGQPEGCVQRADALNRMREYVTAAHQETRCNLIQKGDWLWYYVANTDASGLHSVIFLDWDGNTGYAHCFSGQWGQTVKYMRVCLRPSRCGASHFMPISRIKRARVADNAPTGAPAPSVPEETDLPSNDNQTPTTTPDDDNSNSQGPSPSPAPSPSPSPAPTSESGEPCNTAEVKSGGRYTAENPGRAGVCKPESECTGDKEPYSTGKCPGNRSVKCCVPKRT